VQTAYDNLRGIDYTPNMFLQELRRIANGGDGTSAQPAAPGAKGRRSKTVNPAVGNEEEFNNNFHRALTEKANVDVDWEDLGKRDAEAEGEADPEPEAAPARNGSDNSLSLDAITGAAKALKYIEKLERMDVWGYEEIPVEEYLAPMTLSVIDVAGVDHNVSDFVVDKIMRTTWGEATTKGLAHPVFFVLEEAHNFVPGGPAEGHASKTIKRIASEGRKFGIFLVLITQRPYKVHSDTLSQCNSQIIMRLTNPQDQLAVKQSSESISEGLLADLPGLNVGEAVVLGPLVRVPVMVNVGERVSKEGGNDIDVVAALENARSDALTVGRTKKAQEEKKARGKSEWKEEID
jgi:hypothetical protein